MINELNKLVEKLRESFARGSGVRSAGTADRIEAARITSTKLKALKRPSTVSPSNRSAINGLLTKASKLYTELKLQKAPPESPSGLLKNMD